MVIVDTSVWIDYLGGAETPQTRWLDRELTRQRIGITDLILCETLQGIKDDRQFEKTREKLLKLEIFSTGGVALAQHAAYNYRQIRASGYTIRKTIDSLIATFCLANDHTLLHNDKDFEPFERALGLSVIHP